MVAGTGKSVEDLLNCFGYIWLSHSREFQNRNFGGISGEPTGFQTGRVNKLLSYR